MYRFYAPKSDFREGSVTLAADETHHLRDVLRQKQGNEVHVFDGEGNEFRCRIDAIEKRETLLTILENMRPAGAESGLDLTLASTVLKGDKFDLVIQKAVELGVTRLIPLFSLRCEAKSKDMAKKLQRWRRISLDAAKQCGRATEMPIGDIRESLSFFTEAEGDNGLRVLFAERGGVGFDSITPKMKITAVIGPKGGWEDSELETALSNGFRIITLGGRIMRAETAAIAIVAILQHRFGDLN